MYRLAKNALPYRYSSKKIIYRGFIHFVLACTGILTAFNSSAAILTQTQHFELSISEVRADVRVDRDGGDSMPLFFFSNTAPIRFSGLDPVLGALTSVTQTVDFRYRGEVAASVRGPGGSGLLSLNIGNFVIEGLLPSGLDSLFVFGISPIGLRVLCDETPFLCLGRQAFSRSRQNVQQFNLADDPAIAAYNVADTFDYDASLNLGLQRFLLDNSVDQSTRFGFSAEATVTGDLTLAYEYIPAIRNAIPEPSMLWLFSMGLLPLAMRWFKRR